MKIINVTPHDVIAVPMIPMIRYKYLSINFSGGGDVFGGSVFDADVFDADVFDADVIGADVIGADVIGADVIGADVVGADVVDGFVDGFVDGLVDGLVDGFVDGLVDGDVSNELVVPPDPGELFSIDSILFKIHDCAFSLLNSPVTILLQQLILGKLAFTFFVNIKFASMLNFGFGFCCIHLSNSILTPVSFHLHVAFCLAKKPHSYLLSPIS
jgi:hypothetical protein